jgi:ribosomal protein S6--L-glutamate ligase
MSTDLEETSVTGSNDRLVWITSPDNYDPEVQRRLQREGSERVDILRSHGFSVTVVHSCDVVPGWAGRPRLWYREEDLLERDAGFILTAWTWDSRLSEHLSAIARTVRTSERVLLTDGMADPERLGYDKLAMYQHAGSLGIPVLPTVVVPFGRYARRALPVAVREIEGDTYLVKPRSLAMGIGVLKAESGQQLTAAIDLIAPSGLGCIIQPYLAGASDVRVYVSQGEAIAALRRQPATGSYLANVSQGGAASRFDLDSEVTGMSERLAHSLAADYLCVDWLVSERGPVLNEWMTISAAFEDLPEPDKSRVAVALADHLRRQLAGSSPGLAAAGAMPSVRLG